jgi:hypothetical protein
LAEVEFGSEALRGAAIRNAVAIGLSELGGKALGGVARVTAVATPFSIGLARAPSYQTQKARRPAGNPQYSQSSHRILQKNRG